VQQPERHEFIAVIEGIELSPETVRNIERAVQKAVMNEVANIDLDRSVALRIPLSEDTWRTTGGGGGGQTEGIWVKGGALA
jgi:hypothetical protein